MRRKMGPWSQEEKDFIAASSENLSVNEIADQISRDPESVAKYIRKNLGMRIQKKGKLQTLSSGTDIQNSFIWRELKKEFTDDELEVFLYHWNRTILQFKEDVFTTEEMQIIDMIKIEILMGRLLKKQKEDRVKIERIQNDIERVREENGGVFDIKIEGMERMLAALKSAYELGDKQFNDLLNRKSVMLKEMKGTRDQRLKRIEDSKTTFVGWMSELLNNPGVRRELGEYIEKHRLASRVEEERLIRPHKYVDGSEDLPLLTPEVVEKLAQEEEKESE
jgi:hypothetical protein